MFRGGIRFSASEWGIQYPLDIVSWNMEIRGIITRVEQKCALMLVRRVVSSAPSTVATLRPHGTIHSRLQSSPMRAEGQDQQDQESVDGQKWLVCSTLSSLHF